MLYVMSDVHLSFSVDKDMGVFGGRWEGYVKKIEVNWQALVKKGDTVLVPGDVSWADCLMTSYLDFKFLDGLNGTKVLINGNHDYYWSTSKKVNNFIDKSGFVSIKFIKNDSYVVCCETGFVYVVSGVRGWVFPTYQELREFVVDGVANVKGCVNNVKIYNRELVRFKLSLCDGRRKIERLINGGVDERKVKFITIMHYPPIDVNAKRLEFIKLMKEYGVSACYYGHLHEKSFKNAVEGVFDGIKLKLVSSDYLNFVPYKIDG